MTYWMACAISIVAWPAGVLALHWAAARMVRGRR